MSVNNQLAVLLNLAQFQTVLQVIMLNVMIIIVVGATLIIIMKMKYLFVRVLEV